MKYIISSLILISTILSGQDFTGISFDNETVCWKDYFWYDSLSVYKQKFDLVQAPVLIDDSYVLTIANSNVIDKEGYIAVLKDLVSGEEIWQREEFSQERYTRKIVNNFLIKDGVLELYIMEEVEHYEDLIPDFWSHAHIAFIRIDLYTGETLEEIKTVYDDPENYAHFVRRNNTQRKYFGYVDSLFKVVDVGYIYNSYAADSASAWSAISEFDIKGHLVTSDTTFYPSAFIRIPFFSVNAWFDHKGNYSKIIGGQMINDSVRGISILVSDFTKVRTVDVSSTLQDRPDQWVFNSAQSENGKFIVCATTPWVDHDTPIRSSCFLFEESGKLLDSMTHSYIYSDRNQLFNATFDVENDKMFFLSKYDSDGVINFDIFNRNALGEIDTLINLQLFDEDLFIFGIIPSYLGNNRFMLDIIHRQPSIPVESTGATGPLFHFYSVIDLNKSTNTTIESEVPSISVYPNPTHSILNIAAPDRDITDWKLYTSYGTIVKSGEHAIQQLDMTDLVTGTYILVLGDKNGQESEHKIMKMER